MPDLATLTIEIDAAWEAHRQAHNEMLRQTKLAEYERAHKMAYQPKAYAFDSIASLVHSWTMSGLSAEDALGKIHARIAEGNQQTERVRLAQQEKTAAE